MSGTYKQLGSIAQIFTGVPTKTSRRRGSGESVDVLTVRALEDGELRVEDLQAVNVLGKVGGRNQVWSGDVLLPSRSTSLKFGIVPPELTGTPINSTLIGIRCLPELDPRLLVAYFSHPEGEAQILNVSQSGTDQLNITAKALATIEVPVPSVDAQRQLIDLLGAADEAYYAATQAAESRRRLAREMAVRQITQ